MSKPTIVRVHLPEVCLPDTVFNPVHPATSCSPPPAGSIACCYVSGVSCSGVSCTYSRGVPGLRHVKFLIVFTLNINIVSPGGVIVCRTSQTSEFFQTVTLSSRPGTMTFCQAFFHCGPCVVIDKETCCPLEACLAVWTVPCRGPRPQVGTGRVPSGSA